MSKVSESITGNASTKSENIDVTDGTSRLPAATTHRLVPASDVGGEELFIQSLRKGEKDSSQQSEALRFENLKVLHDSEKHKNGKSNFKVKEVNDLTQYMRMASVYLKNMHNKFFVPVWCSAFQGKTGYILYPKLTPVTKMLSEVRSRNNEEDMNQAVRLSLHIVFGVEAIHTHVENNRDACCHRDIRIDNVFVSEVKTKDTKYKDMNVYGEAMLLISELTRTSRNMDSVDQETSRRRNRIVEWYFNHPDPFKDLESSLYLKRYDWYSVGVYILEVLGIVLNTRLDQKKAKEGDEKTEYFIAFADQLRDTIKQRKFSGKKTSETWNEYIDIAMKYIKDNHNLSTEQIMMHEYKGKRYFFEYGLRKETAKLLCTFDVVCQDANCNYQTLQDVVNERVMEEIGKKERKRKRKAIKQEGKADAIEEEPAEPIKPEKVHICQACLLRPSVTCEMRAYRRGAYRRAEPGLLDKKDRKCDESCNRFYCAQCYVNGERLFCPMQHGTASSVLGHYTSFALILYGDQFKEGDGDTELFKRDAEDLSSILKHKMIVGMPEKNVLVRPIHCDMQEEGTKEASFQRSVWYDEIRCFLVNGLAAILCCDVCENNEVATAKDRLQKYCNEIRNLIHMTDDVGKCVNDTDYCLYIFYSGHGGSISDPGDWAATDLDHITREEVHSCLDSIIACESIGCKGSCIIVQYVRDCCYPTHSSDASNIERRYINKVEKKIVTSISSQYENTTGLHSSGRSAITHWLCALLRSTFKDDCKVENCETCEEMLSHIKKRCFNAFITGQSLTTHKKHMEHLNRDREEKAQTNIYVDVDPKLVLARFNPDGVYYRVFPVPFGKDRKSVEMDFSLTLGYSKIKEEVLNEMKKRNPRAQRICLLTNNEVEDAQYGLVWASDVRKKLESTTENSSSQLFYRVVTYPVTVILCDQTLGIEDLLVLDIDKSDIVSLVVDWKVKGSIDTLPSHERGDTHPGELQNLLAHIVHHIWHNFYLNKEYREEDTSGKQTSINTESENGSTGGTSNQTLNGTSSTPMAVKESTAPTKEGIRNNFANRVRLNSQEVQLESLDRKEWRRLEDDARQYWAVDRDRPFKVCVENEGNCKQIRVSWTEQEEKSSASKLEDVLIDGK